MLDQSTALSENIDSALLPVVDLVPPDGRIAVGGDPHAGEVIRMDFVVYELAQAVLVHVDAARLAVMDFAVNYRRVGSSLHFEAGDAVVVDVVRLEVALRTRQPQQALVSGCPRHAINTTTYHSAVECEDADVASVVYVIAPHDGVRSVLDPDSGQGVSTNFIVFVQSLCVVRHV